MTEQQQQIIIIYTYRWNRLGLLNLHKSLQAKMQIQIQQVWCEAWDATFLISSQVTPMLHSTVKDRDEDSKGHRAADTWFKYKGNTILKRWDMGWALRNEEDLKK